MSTLAFYRAQAVSQQAAADAATLEKARSRHQEAADSWAEFANEWEERASLRTKLAAARTESVSSKTPGDGKRRRKHLS
jgi:hypothetical protein